MPTSRSPRRSPKVSRATWPLMLALIGLIGAPAQGQVSPEESAKQLKPAPGLSVSLWAAEPLVENPTTIDVDSRGRVWVTEGLNYRLTRGGNRQFERIPGADRIKILEDTNGDGRADKVTVFAEDIFPVPMGIAIEEFWSEDGQYEGCKVYVGNSPDLLVLEDTDGDDVADKRYPLLTGFGGVDSDHGVHGPVLGLDGKLYFTQGDGCCSVQDDGSEKTENFDVKDRSGRRVWSDQLANTLRVNRDGTQFEVIADRQRNNYETCLNSFGNQFTSDNDDDGHRGCRVIWVMDGGNYGYRTPGSPRHWAEEVPGVVPKLVGTGNGSPCGIMVYEGRLLPDEYFGALLEADAGPRVIYAFPLSRQGASFRTETQVMLSSDDPWFRPVDVCASPDGSLFVADWYDAGVGGHGFRDQTTGRIYRIVPEGEEVPTSELDFASIDGLIETLRSPNVATRDAARRLLIERGKESRKPLAALFENDETQAIDRARALWVLHAIQGDSAAIRALKDHDPQIREQGVRILGRDVSRNGQVELDHPEAMPELAAMAHLDALLPMASDPDAGVRRELILALRDLPTEKVGEALRTLAASWDGRDRWYLEALGLAIRHREPSYLQGLFDGSLYGDLDLDRAGRVHVATPPYFPVDRNEAYLAAGDELPSANALSKTLGLAWVLRRVESFPLIARVLPSLKTPELQQAADDAILHVEDPAGAILLAEMALDRSEPVRRRQVLANLVRKLDRDWRSASGDPQIIAAIESALDDPGTRTLGLQLAGVTGSDRFTDSIREFAEAGEASVEVRVAAIEALARRRDPRAAALVDHLIDQAKQEDNSNPAAEAAVRALPRLGEAGDRLAVIFQDEAVPLGLRREALRNFATLGDGGNQLLTMAREKTLPEALQIEAATALRAHPDGRVRHEAQQLFPIVNASGQPLPPVEELIRLDADVDRGRAVFYREGTNSCGSCHRVQGRGDWVGPDLSSIGSKYGKEQLLRSILNPSEAISFNFHSVVVALEDGRVLTGLPVEDSPDRLVLKLADGQRVEIPSSEIESRRQSDVSLMPEGLASNLSTQDLADLLAFLSTLRQPVSIVGQAYAVGPFVDPPSSGQAGVDAAFAGVMTHGPSQPVTIRGSDPVDWRRVTADAEGRLDLSPFLGDDPKAQAYLFIPITSPEAQSAQLVLESRTDFAPWLDGRPQILPRPGDGPVQVGSIDLPAGSSRLVLRVKQGDDSSIVVTFVSDAALEFQANEPPADAKR